MGEERKKTKKRERLDVTIEVVPESEGKAAPFVGYFPSGFDPSSDGENAVNVRAFRNSERYKTGRLQLVVNHDSVGVDFVGTNYAGEGAVSQPCTYALGVLDKENSSLKILPIAGNKIFRLEPRVRGFDYQDTELEESKGEELTSENRLNRLRALTASFGTKRSKIEVGKIESRRLKEENISTNKTVGVTIEDADKQVNLMTQQEILESTNAAIVRDIPPFDLTATSPENAYPLDKIIPKAEWPHLRDILELLEGGSGVSLRSRTDYPIFVRNRLYKVEENRDHKAKEKLAGILSYITYLVKFIEIPNRSMEKLLEPGSSHKEMPKIPGSILIKFMKMFGESKQNARPREKPQLLVSYILVLTLFADDFESNPADIAKDLKMTLQSLRPFYMELGCKFNKNSCAILSVPLKFPTVDMRPRGGRRPRR